MVLTPDQDSGNGKLGLGEFATLWKKVQKYLVSLNPKYIYNIINVI